MSAAALLLIAVAFAFSDEQGARLLATSDIANPHILRVALCSGAPQPVAIEFDHTQSEGRGSTGRQAPQNFAHTAGAVFRIVSGTVAAGATCVLADESLTAGATLMSLKRPPQNARCSKAEYPQIQVEKQRAVVGCWPIAEGAAGIHVAIVEFSRYLTRALASLVVVDGDRRMYIDYPADFRGPGADMWRADDGGEIHAEGFEVVFLLKRGTTYVLAVDWSGAEGDALSVNVAEDGGQFKEVITDSWYRSPM
jgi:hypothetical protein